MDLNGKAVLVTGGTMGLGAAIALELARRGVPAEPVRLFAKGSAFATGDELALDFEQDG